MKSALTLVAAVTAAALMVVGCSSPTTEGTADLELSGHVTAAVPNEDPVPVAVDPVPQLPTTVRSFDGVDVTVTDVSRIVTADLYGTLTATVFALGLGDNVVGRSTSADFPAAREIPNITPGGQSLNAEAILALSPTVFLTDTSIGPKSVQDQLRAAGVPVVYFDPDRALDTVPEQIMAVADALGVPAQGEQAVARTDAEIAEALARIPADAPEPKIGYLYLRGPAITMIGGPGSGADSLIESIGAVDAGTASGVTQRYVAITSEALIAAAPDVLLLMSSGLESIGGVDGLEKIPGIAQTPAGIAKRVVDVEDGKMLSFGTSTGTVLGALIDAIYYGTGEQ